MKKTKGIALCAVAGLLLGLSLSACGTGSQTTVNGKTYEILTSEQPDKELITLGNLNELIVDGDAQALTDADIREYAQNKQKVAYTAPEGTVAQEGDLVTVFIIGMKDGQPLEDETTASREIVLGTGQIDQELENAFLGMKEQEEKEVTVTQQVPEGEEGTQQATYHLILRKITRLTEPTPEELEAAKQELEAYRTSEQLKAYGQQAWEQLVETVDVKGLPERYMNEYREFYDQNTVANFESLSAYLKEMSVTKAEYEKEKEAYAVRQTISILLIDALNEYFQIQKDSEEYAKEEAQVLQDLGLSKEDAIQSFGEQRVERSVYHNLIIKKLGETVTVIGAGASPSEPIEEEADIPAAEADSLPAETAAAESVQPDEMPAENTEAVSPQDETPQQP